MEIGKSSKDAFTVIGKEGSTDDGQDFISKLWDAATEKFGEIENLVKKDENGSPVGFWGAMSDFSRTFAPWEDNFTKGLYLAGAECDDSAEPPEGWTKWIIPAFEYLYAECKNDNTFPEMIKYLQENNIPLAGAVHDFICPQTGKKYMYFPVKAKDHKSHKGKLL